MASPTESESRLSTSNAVRTRTINWYNAQKKVIATADLGTEQGGVYRGGEFVHATRADRESDIGAELQRNDGRTDHSHSAVVSGCACDDERV